MIRLQRSIFVRLVISLVAILSCLLLVVNMFHQQQKAHADAIPSMILDTDIFTDVGDVGALAQVNALMDMGKLNLLAVGVDTSSQYSAQCVSAIDTYYGNGNIPIGITYPVNTDHGPQPDFVYPCATNYPQQLQDPSAIPTTLSVYRQALASQPDHSVTFVCIGYEGRLSELLNSSPDGYSSLNGHDLVAQKVKELVVMGGNFPSSASTTTDSPEWNFQIEPAAAADVANNWPTHIAYSGAEIGFQIQSGSGLTSNTPANSPVRGSYEIYVGPNNGRFSWDENATYWAVTHDTSVFGEVTNGSNQVDPTTGANTWVSNPVKDQEYLTLLDANAAQSKFDALLNYVPGNSGGSNPTPTPTAQPTNTPTPQPTPTPTGTPISGSLVTAINAGGTAAGNFVADTDVDQGNEYSDTSSAIDTSGVSNPAPQAVYQSCRWNSAFTYTIPNLVAGASYTVQLDWAELTFNSAGSRQFNVAINGTNVLSNFDVYAVSGYKKALARSFTATATSNGTISIAFSQGSADNPFVNGIEIYQSTGTTATPTPTTTATVTPTALPTATPTPSSGSLVAAINAGGSGVGSFVADTGYNQGSQYTDTASAIDTSGVSNPAPQSVYQSCRWNSAFTYTISKLTAGASYKVRLHWAELTFQTAGGRKFNVAINGSQVLSGFDVYGTVGYKKALIKDFTTSANGSGQIVIAFSQGGADNPFVNGIEVYTA